MFAPTFDEQNIAWYHGAIDRKEAENKLEREQPVNGAIFLIRESSTVKGDCVISLYDGKKMYHHQIRRYGDDAFFGIDEDKPTHGLEILISNLQRNSTFGVRLVSFVRNEPPPDLFRFIGRTNIIHKVVKLSDIEMLSRLLDSGYKFINAKDENGKTAVHHVCENKNIDPKILKKLIEHEAHVNTFDAEGNKPIHLASQYRDVEIINILIDAKVDLQQSNLKTGCTPLHEAAKGGNFEIVKLLLKNGVAVRPRNFNKEFPISIAINFGYSEIEKYLNAYVPTVRTSRDEWYHGKLDRPKAEEILRNHADKYYEKYRRTNRNPVADAEKEKGDVTSGIFLVRSSAVGNDPDPAHFKYVISVLYKNEMKNYRIQTNGKYHYLEAGPFLDSLEHLIEFYKKYSDGIPCRLKEGVMANKKPARCGPYQLSELRDRIKIEANVVVTKDNLTILRDRELGSGAFGIVFQGILETPNGKVPVAIKTLNDDCHVNRDEFLREATIMMKLRNPNIVNILGILENPELMLVQEFMYNGSLEDYLKSCSDTIDNNIIIKWAGQIATGMNYLESQKFVHRDLAARNILIETLQQVKISDFGLSRATGADSDYYKAKEGGRWPIKWYAPESATYGEFSHASDVWSYGVTLWEIYSDGKEPYEDIDESEQQDLIELIEDGLRLRKPEKCPNDVFAVMSSCWEEDPTERPTFKHLLKFFNKYGDS